MGREANKPLETAAAVTPSRQSSTYGIENLLQPFKVQRIIGCSHEAVVCLAIVLMHFYKVLPPIHDIVVAAKLHSTSTLHTDWRTIDVIMAAGLHTEATRDREIEPATNS